MATKTFVMKKGGVEGIIPIGHDRLHVEPGVPFTVDEAEAQRFEESPDYDAVEEAAVEPPKPKETKTK